MQQIPGARASFTSAHTRNLLHQLLRDNSQCAARSLGSTLEKLAHDYKIQAVDVYKLGLHKSYLYACNAANSYMQITKRRISSGRIRPQQVEQAQPERPSLWRQHVAKQFFLQLIGTQTAVFQSNRPHFRSRTDSRCQRSQQTRLLCLKLLIAWTPVAKAMLNNAALRCCEHMNHA